MFENVEPVECIENRSNMVVFEGFRQQAVYLGDVYVQEKRIAAV